MKTHVHHHLPEYKLGSVTNTVHHSVSRAGQAKRHSSLKTWTIWKYIPHSKTHWWPVMGRLPNVEAGVVPGWEEASRLQGRVQENTDNGAHVSKVCLGSNLLLQEQKPLPTHTVSDPWPSSTRSPTPCLWISINPHSQWIVGRRLLDRVLDSWTSILSHKIAIPEPINCDSQKTD